MSMLLSKTDFPKKLIIEHEIYYDKLCNLFYDKLLDFINCINNLDSMEIGCYSVVTGYFLFFNEQCFLCLLYRLFIWINS